MAAISSRGDELIDRNKCYKYMNKTQTNFKHILWDILVVAHLLSCKLSFYDDI